VLKRERLYTSYTNAFLPNTENRPTKIDYRKKMHVPDKYRIKL